MHVQRRALFEGKTLVLSMTAILASKARTQVSHAPVHPELSIGAVLRVDAGGPGVDPASAAAELHLATEEGASDAKGVSQFFLSDEITHLPFILNIYLQNTIEYQENQKD